jgi:hypothetical protein
MAEWTPLELQGSIYDWRRVWRTPLGAFVIGMVVVVATLGWAFFDFREDIFERRVAFCASENLQSKRARLLWEGVIAESQRSDGETGHVLVGGKRIPVVFQQDINPAQLKRFRELVRDTYPLRDCSARP